MEERKTLGAFICRRRKELGMTQREFAQRLFVTESAVSKWERGLSYPDITMIRDICALLDISEHELFIAAAGVLLGLSLFFLPVLLHQLPLGHLSRHKGLLYFSFETLLLFGLLILCDLSDEGAWFLRLGLPLSCFLLALPWGWLLALRYLPVRMWLRFSAAFGWPAVYVWSFSWALERLLLLSGDEVQLLHAFGPRPNFFCWDTPWIISENVSFLIFLGLLLLTAVCAAMGWRERTSSAGQ